MKIDTKKIKKPTFDDNEWKMLQDAEVHFKRQKQPKCSRLIVFLLGEF